MDVYKIIQKYYHPKSEAYRILVRHSELVTQKAMMIGQSLVEQGVQVDLDFLKEAAMLHDIGIFLTNAPDINCHGTEPYIKHGILGRELLENEGYPKHSLVCERHVGVGLTVKDIESQKLPLPTRDMQPISIEEKIVCFADEFYSKDPKNLDKESSEDEILEELKERNADNLERFQNLKKALSLV
jgi:uncharacterized protein